MCLGAGLIAALLLAVSCGGGDSTPAPTLDLEGTATLTTTATEPPASATTPPTSVPLTPTLVDPATDAALRSLAQAVLGGDLDAILARIILLDLACAPAPGLGGPPPCAAAEPAGSIVSVLPFTGCEGEHVRADLLPAFLQSRLFGQEKSLYAVVALDSEAVSPLFPRGEYGLIFRLEATGTLVEGGMMLEANTAGDIVTIYAGCALTAAQIFDRFSDGGILLPPTVP